MARGQLAGQPLCMEQYYRLLNSYRLPGIGQDCLVSVEERMGENPTVVVAYKNQVYTILFCVNRVLIH